ncbi:uncharacterized protein LOC106674281 [Cimex lectularius]|uniref:Protein sleepless n=1 Tax=Cimex lectularius TaxID=79782 RepID=A0A8I6SJ55_CIMLE|nr:uncharacterized protein LOC106674281 [Cimex lectularius]
MNQNMPPIITITLIPIIVAFVQEASGERNLSCYQCVKTTPEPCSEEELLPCPANKDRCVTHITKEPSKGYKIKRECGLYPCMFDDLMMNRGLGLDGCDMQKDELFCLFCCKENGCNSARISAGFDGMLIFAAIIVSTFGAISAVRIVL